MSSSTLVFSIRLLTTDDVDWVRQIVSDRMAAAFVVGHGVTYYPHELPGFVAMRESERIGLLNYQIDGDTCEIVTLFSLQSTRGIGTALIEAVRAEAVKAGCQRLWVTTTNDNLNALGFYQKRGFELVAVHRNALEATRKLKPALPMIGMNGIPLRDELELEMHL